jgi:putative tricarboxylic transport membrane protein
LAAARGNQNHLATGVALRAANVDVRPLKIVIFDSSALSMTALLGGHVDAVAATALNVLPHLKAGRVRVLAITSPQRLTGELAVVPTWREQGVDAVFDNWRGIIGPRGMQPGQIAFWEEALAKVVETDEWKAELERNYFTNSFMKSRESRQFLEREYGRMKALLTDLGLTK